MSQKKKPKTEEIIRKIDVIIREMNNDRHDGYVKQSYRIDLTEIRDYLTEALKE